MFGLLITEILYRPVFNLLIVFLTFFGGNLGVGIVLLTITIRMLLIKQTSAGNDMQKGMSNLQPKLQEIQEKYKDDPKKLSAETMKVFKKEGKGPLKGCLQMLVQIPVFIGLYYVIRHIAGADIPEGWMYSFVTGFGGQFMDLENIKTNFLGIDLLGTKNIVLTLLAAAFTFLQMKLTMLARPETPKLPGTKTPDMGKMMGFMNIFMVFMIGSVVYSMQSGIGLYIVTTTLFSVVQYTIQYRVLLKAKFLEWRSKGQNVIIEKN